MSKKDKNHFSTILILLILGGLAILAWRNGWIPTNIGNKVAYSPIYDTDAANDQFIKGDLTLDQMRKLDRVLVQEQRNQEARLSTEQVRPLSGNDKAVMEAYGRWRKCYDMMRGRDHVIYPNQRGS
jgi:hypothetical protein